MLALTDKAYFEPLFWMNPDLKIKFGKKPVLTQNLNLGCKENKFYQSFIGFPSIQMSGDVT